MIKENKYRLAALMALICVAWAACTQVRQPCNTPKIASLNMEFMHKTTDTATVFVDTVLTTAALIAFTDSGAAKFIYPNPSADVTISLSSISDTCKWGFTTDTTFAHGIDTLTFFYTRNPQFISNACSFADFFTIDSVHTTHRMIDSLLITNTAVTNDVNTTHLHIYIHPDF